MNREQLIAGQFEHDHFEEVPGSVGPDCEHLRRIRLGVETDDDNRVFSGVLDVGITRTDAGLVGDVAPGVAEVAGCLAPMPGGVGPMTRAMLLANVVDAAEQRLGQ